MKWEYWLKERGTECYCPIELDDEGRLVEIITGMNLMGEPKGQVLGEFWYDQNGDIDVEAYKDRQA